MTEYKYEYNAKRNTHAVCAREDGGEWRVVQPVPDREAGRQLVDQLRGDTQREPELKTTGWPGDA